MAAFLFDLVGWILCVIGGGMLLVTSFLYLQDAARQEPRFRLLLRVSGGIFLGGIVIIGLNALFIHFVPILIFGLFTTFLPVSLVVFVSYNFLKEATKDTKQVSLIVFGGLATLGFGIILFILKAVLL